MLDEKDEKIRPSEEANANSDISRRLHILCCTVRLDEARDLTSVTTRLRKRSGTRAQSREGTKPQGLPGALFALLDCVRSCGEALYPFGAAAEGLNCARAYRAEDGKRWDLTWLTRTWRDGRLTVRCAI